MRMKWAVILSFLMTAVLAQSWTPQVEAASPERGRTASSLAASDWSTPVNISKTNADSYTPRIGVDKNGKAYVIWSDWTDVPRVVYFSTNKSGQWAAAQTVYNMEYESVEACFPSLATTAEGECHLSLQDVDQSYDIFYFQYKDNAWKTPENVSTNPTGASVYSSITVSPMDDYAYIIWQDEFVNEWDLLYSHRAPDTTFGWEWPQLIPLFGGHMYFPNATVDGQGTLHLVFHTREGENSTVWYTKNATPRNNANWTSPVPVGPNVGSEWSYPMIAGDDNGEVYVVWNGRTGQGARDVFLRKTVNKSWQAIENISQSQENSAGVCVAVNRSTGEIYVGWHEIVGSNWQVMLKSFERPRASDEKTWSSAVNLSNSNAMAAWPRMAIAENGDIHLVYADEKSGNMEIYYTFKLKILVFSPINLSLKTSYNKVLFYNEKINTITFDKNPENDDSLVASYKLYRKLASESNNKFQLLATLTPSTFKYDDRQLPHATKYAYTVTMVDADGNESRITDVVAEK
ncbi:MAG: hypothetical protein FJY82_14165 [Candidatus Aminicenantes bacterium]|nr:hypothetical protein [Candidatus Aminicenantes bacterium]